MSLEKFIADLERKFQELKTEIAKLPTANDRAEAKARAEIVAEFKAVNRALQKARAALR